MYNKVSEKLTNGGLPYGNYDSRKNGK
jgi:hypothetical protein